MNRCKQSKMGMHRFKRDPIGKWQKDGSDYKMPIRQTCTRCGHVVEHDPKDDSTYLWNLSGMPF